MCVLRDAGVRSVEARFAVPAGYAKPNAQAVQDLCLGIVFPQAASIAASALSRLPTVCRAVMSTAQKTGFHEQVPVANSEI